MKFTYVQLWYSLIAMVTVMVAVPTMAMAMKPGQGQEAARAAALKAKTNGTKIQEWQQQVARTIWKNPETNLAETINKFNPFKPTPTQWTCPSCTFRNDIAAEKCAVCGVGTRPANIKPALPLQPETAAATWRCPDCTFENAAAMPQCEQCEKKRPTSTKQKPAEPKPAPEEKKEAAAITTNASIIKFGNNFTKIAQMYKNSPQEQYNAVAKLSFEMLKNATHKLNQQEKFIAILLLSGKVASLSAAQAANAQTLALKKLSEETKYTKLIDDLFPSQGATKYDQAQPILDSLLNSIFKEVRAQGIDKIGQKLIVETFMGLISKMNQQITDHVKQKMSDLSDLYYCQNPNCLLLNFKVEENPCSCGRKYQTPEQEVNERAEVINAAKGNIGEANIKYLTPFFNTSGSSCGPIAFLQMILSALTVQDANTLIAGKAIDKKELNPTLKAKQERLSPLVGYLILAKDPNIRSDLANIIYNELYGIDDLGYCVKMLTGTLSNVIEAQGPFTNLENDTVAGLANNPNLTGLYIKAGIEEDTHNYALIKHGKKWYEVEQWVEQAAPTKNYIKEIKNIGITADIDQDSLSYGLAKITFTYTKDNNSPDTNITVRYAILKRDVSLPATHKKVEKKPESQPPLTDQQINKIRVLKSSYANLGANTPETLSISLRLAAKTPCHLWPIFMNEMSKKLVWPYSEQIPAKLTKQEAAAVGKLLNQIRQLTPESDAETIKDVFNRIMGQTPSIQYILSQQVADNIGVLLSNLVYRCPKCNTLNMVLETNATKCFACEAPIHQPTRQAPPEEEKKEAAQQPPSQQLFEPQKYSELLSTWVKDVEKKAGEQKASEEPIAPSLDKFKDILGLHNEQQCPGVLSNPALLDYQTEWPAVKNGNQPSPTNIIRRIVQANTKICFMGDIHGSLGALIRNLHKLQELKFLDANFKINDNNLMVFTGDYVSRGKHIVGVIYTFLLLVTANPNQVILLRGNHEDPDISGQDQYGNVAQLEKLFPKVKQNTRKPAENFFNNHLRFQFFDRLPIALLLGIRHGQGINWLQCCHGGVDPIINFKEFLQKDLDFGQYKWANVFSTVKYNIDASPLLNVYQGAKENLLAVLNSKPEVDQASRLLKYPNNNGYIWSEFCDGISNTPFNTSQNSINIFEAPYKSSGIGGIKTGSNITSETAQALGIVGFIRGHQHDLYGVKIGGERKWDEQGQIAVAGRVTGYTGLPAFKFGAARWPLLTLSTASESADIDEPYDSFIILDTTGNDHKNWVVNVYEEIVPDDRFWAPNDKTALLAQLQSQQRLFELIRRAIVEKMPLQPKEESKQLAAEEQKELESMPLSQTEPVEEKGPATTQWKCSMCGKQYTTKIIFCEDCGGVMAQKISSDEPREKKEPPKQLSTADVKKIIEEYKSLDERDRPSVEEMISFIAQCPKDQHERLLSDFCIMLNQISIKTTQEALHQQLAAAIEKNK